MYRTDWTIKQEEAFDNLFVVRFCDEFMATFKYLSEARFYVGAQFAYRDVKVCFKADGSVVLEPLEKIK